MYYILDYRRFWSYKRAFGKFSDAFMIQQLVDPNACIEYFDGEKHEVVWDPRWEYQWC